MKNEKIELMDTLAELLHDVNHNYMIRKSKSMCLLYDHIVVNKNIKIDNEILSKLYLPSIPHHLSKFASDCYTLGSLFMNQHNIVNYDEQFFNYCKKIKTYIEHIDCDGSINKELVYNAKKGLDKYINIL